MSELKPCPFCGGTDLREYPEYIECKSCGMTGPDVDGTYQEAEEEWNKRSTPKLSLVPKGEPMPQTIEAWQHLGELYEQALIKEKEENSKLKQALNELRQRQPKKRCIPDDLDHTSADMIRRVVPEGYKLAPIDLLEAVAHIGVDFGFGKYELEQKHIDSARAILDAAENQK